MKVFDNILQTIGHTPLVQLKNSVPQGPHKYFAKLEFFNPGGSIKDRMALKIIVEAEKRGLLKPGGTVVEATAGNTGIGLAMICAVRGYRCIFTMPSKMSQEKIDMLKAFGAEVIITQSGVAADDPKSHYNVAKQKASEIKGSFLANQFHNPDNSIAHYETTGPEIWEQTNGKVDVVVAGAGTGGTLSGAGKFLKEKNPNIKVIGPDPIGSILHDVKKYGEIRTPPAKYEMEGIGEDMIPENVHFQIIDEFVQTNDKESFMKCHDILKKDGIFVGPSSGANLMAAIKYGEKIKEPKNFVVIFPDNGSKYMSKLYNDNWLKSKGFI